MFLTFYYARKLTLKSLSDGPEAFPKQRQFMKEAFQNVDGFLFVNLKITFFSTQKCA